MLPTSQTGTVVDVGDVCGMVNRAQNVRHADMHTCRAGQSRACHQRWVRWWMFAST